MERHPDTLRYMQRDIHASRHTIIPHDSPTLPGFSQTVVLEDQIPELHNLLKILEVYGIIEKDLQQFCRDCPGFADSGGKVPHQKWYRAGKFASSFRD